MKLWSLQNSKHVAFGFNICNQHSYITIARFYTTLHIIRSTLSSSSTTDLRIPQQRYHWITQSQHLISNKKKTNLIRLLMSTRTITRRRRDVRIFYEFDPTLPVFIRTRYSRHALHKVLANYISPPQRKCSRGGVWI